MVKNIFTAVLVFVLACFMAIGCTKKQAKVKAIVPTSTVKIDTIIRFNKDAACKIHINYVYLKVNSMPQLTIRCLEWALCNPITLQQATKNLHLSR